jgi:hypothetical protein
MAHSTTSSVRATNAVEEMFVLTQRPPNSANQSCTSTAGRKQSPNWLANFKRAATSMVQPKKTLTKAPTMWRSIQAIVLVSCEMTFLQLKSYIDPVFQG